LPQCKKQNQSKTSCKEVSERTEQFESTAAAGFWE